MALFLSRHHLLFRTSLQFASSHLLKQPRLRHFSKMGDITHATIQGTFSAPRPYHAPPSCAPPRSRARLMSEQIPDTPTCHGAGRCLVKPIAPPPPQYGLPDLVSRWWCQGSRSCFVAGKDGRESKARPDAGTVLLAVFRPGAYRADGHQGHDAQDAFRTRIATRLCTLRQVDEPLLTNSSQMAGSARSPTCGLVRTNNSLGSYRVRGTLADTGTTSQARP